MNKSSYVEKIWHACDPLSIAENSQEFQHDCIYRRDSTLSFVLLSNGVPIGYGGASVIFNQANTGINIFDEYRGSEAPWLWVQVMRVFSTLRGCNRFIANPYQFGGGNTEVLKSGALWFYYRLG
jgi:hypothetical protein